MQTLEQNIKRQIRTDMVKRRDRCDERMGDEAEEGGNGGGMPGGSMYRRRRVRGQNLLYV